MEVVGSPGRGVFEHFGLADPGLTGEDQGGAATTTDAIHEAVELGELTSTPPERRGISCRHGVEGAQGTMA